MPTPRTTEQFTRGRPLSADDFRDQARHVARDLLGTLLVVETPSERSSDEPRLSPVGGMPSELRSDATPRSPVGGLIVETEAYVNGVDPASHLAAGRTPRTASFFSGPGTVYVYTIHGHHALNVITVSDGYPEGVLIRAVEPTHGCDVMCDRRDFDDPGKLTAGPGRLTEALGVTTDEFDDRQLAETPLSLYETDLDPDITVSGRIGVSDAADWPLRFTVTDNAFVSRPVPADESLNDDAVERCYDRLGEHCQDAYAIDEDH